MAKDNSKNNNKIAVLEANYDNMAEKIEDLKQAVEKGFSDLKSELKCYREEADKKYASKQTEKIVNGLVGLIVSAVILALIALVVK